MARLQDKRTFRGINFDDADEYLEDGDTRNMLNVRVNYSESGDDGVITNVKGTVSLFSELSFSLPVGINKCIATCPDDQNNRLIWLNYNSNGDHGVYCYNTDSNTIQTILASSTLGFSDSIIHSIDILDGNLAWVDDNRPRAINVDDGIAGVYGGAPIEELINDAKPVPMYPPVCTTTETTGDNYIKSLKSFQFIYKYVFKNGEKGAWSTVSDLVPTAYRDKHIEKITLDASDCELFTKPSLSNVVDYVEFASRELYTLNFNQFLRMPTSDFLAAGGVVDYYDTESKTSVDTAETGLAFYENPIKAGTVAFQNDRKFYADCTEGYDAFSLSIVNPNVQIIPASGGIPYLSDCNTHIEDRYLKPDSEYNYSVAFYDKYGRKSGAIDLPDLVIQTQEQLSNDYRANVLQFGLNLTAAGSYPSWAEKFEILRSDNKTVTYFVQGRANKVLYCTGYDANDDPTYIKSNPSSTDLNVSDSGAIELHIRIGNWTRFKTNIPYTFTEGDRVTFLTMGGVNDRDSMAALKGLKIKELRGNDLIVDYPQIGRTNLNHAMLGFSIVEVIPAAVYQLIASRFIVGDNGVALYSSNKQLNAAPNFTGWPFPFTTINRIDNFPRISNHLYGVSINYTGVDLGFAYPYVTDIGVYIVGSGGYFIRGTYNPYFDTGSGWTTVNTGVTTDLNSIESSFINHDKANLIMVGDNGVILRYNISGGTVTTQTSGTTENLNYVCRNGTTSSYLVVGDNGTILRTTNNGTTWTQIEIDNCQNLNGVYFRGSYAIAVGDEGLVLVSGDSGVTWTQRGIGTANNLNSVEGDGGDDTLTSATLVFIAGDGGLLVEFDMSIPRAEDTYDTGTTKNINFFQSFYYVDADETDVMLGITLGDLDLLQDVNISPLPPNPAVPTFNSYATNVSSVFGTVFLNYRAKIEIYSPKTTSGPVVYYETGDAHPVGQNYTFNKGKESDGDVFLIRKDFRGDDWTMIGDLIFSMTPDSNNTAGTWDKDLGRPNTVLLYPEKQERRNIIRYSDRYVQDSKINGLSNFQPLNYEPIPNEFGIVRKITPLEYILLINAERESATAYIDQTVFRGADGQDVAATSDRVINNVRKLAGGFGCTNPESVVSYLGQAYWMSSNKGAVCRYNSSNGVFPISEYKARTYWNNKDIVSIISGVEPNFKNALFSILSPVLVEDIQVIKTISVGAGPYGPTHDPDNNRVWIANSGTNTISVIDVLTNAVVQTIGVETGPIRPIYDPDTKRMYCSCTAGFVVVVDCSSYAIVATITTGSNTRPGVYDPINQRMYFPNRLAGTVSVISTATNTVIATIGSMSFPISPIYDPVYENIYFGSEGGSGDIYVVSTSTNTIIQTIPTSGDPNNGCYDPINKKMFFANGLGISTISVVDTTDYSYSTITVGTSPVDTIYVPKKSRVYVSNYGGNTVSIIDPSDNTVEKTISTGTNPRMASYDTVNDLLLVPNYGGDTVSVFDANDNYVLLKTLSVGDGPYAYQLFIKGIQYTYVGNLNSTTVSVISSAGDFETIAFQEVSNRWISKYSFAPERYGHVNNKMFSFKDGVLWKHNASDTYNNFYGVQYTSQVKPVFNKEPHSQKSAMAISLEADRAWTANPITTPEGQESFILSAHFEQINKEWWGDVKQDINTPNMVSTDEALINGNFMESNVFDVVLESQASDATKLKFVNFYSNINHRTNR